MQLAFAIVLAVFFCALIAYNVWSVRTVAKAGGRTAGATIAIRILNAVLLLTALGLVIGALVRT
jgi:hypothetical protein